MLLIFKPGTCQAGMPGFLKSPLITMLAGLYVCVCVSFRKDNDNCSCETKA